MGDKSEMLDALSKWSTSTILSVALVVMVWIDASDEANWDARLAGIMQRQAESQERQEKAMESFAESLVKILEGME